MKGEVYRRAQRRSRVAPGEFLTLLGPSGCGKTTTLRMIAGLRGAGRRQHPIGGRDVTHLPPNQRNIGFVFQNYALFPHLSVFENIAYGLRVQQRPRARSRRGRRGAGAGRPGGLRARSSRTSSPAASSSASRWPARW